MIDIKDLSDLRQFTNFETYDFDGKTIVLYDDHRCLLTALFEASKLGLITSGTNLITFDRHDDAAPIREESWRLIDRFAKNGIASITSREFKDFVEYDISSRDDDWVKVAFELGLIKDFVNIGNVENTNISDLDNHSYISKDGVIHHAHSISLIKDELCPHHGALGDMCLYDQYRNVHEVFGYNLIHTNKGFADNFKADYVLDFDLDCFTTECQSKVFAWPESIFASLYNNEEVGYFMYRLISNSRFITICREPLYCGGIGESNKILSCLDRFFFNGCLGTKTII